MKKIAITGSTGLIGSRVVELLQNEFEFISLTQKTVDITSEASVQSALEPLDFDILFHLAAYTNVDKAEAQKDLAYSLNVTGTKNLLNKTLEKGKQFILISTDFVFDGTTPPYTEESTPNAQGYYGKTKQEAEELVEGKGMIIRPSYPYRQEFEGKKDFVRSIKSLLEQGTELKMISDSLITPTFIDDFAESARYLFNHFSPEIYHIVGSESLSPFQAALMIAETFDLNTSLIQPTSYAEFSKGKAPRPQWSKIISNKNTFHAMTGLKDGLAYFI